MDNNKMMDGGIVKKTGDTLLVLHHETGTVGIVKGLGENEFLRIWTVMKCLVLNLSKQNNLVLTYIKKSGSNFIITT